MPGSAKLGAAEVLDHQTQNFCDVVATRRNRPLDAVRGGPRFAFVGADGHPIVVDTASGSLTSVTEETALTDFRGELGSLALLRDGLGVIGFDPDRLDLAVRVASGSVVASAAGAPASHTSPESGLVTPASRWSCVLLPQPDSPTMPIT